MASYGVILPAAGQSTRFGGTIKKPFLTLQGKPIWQRTIELFHPLAAVQQIVLVIAPEELDDFRQRYAGLFLLAFEKVTLAPGGAERFESVANGLAALRSEVDFVAVHDVVRALTPPSIIEAVFNAAASHGAAILALPVADTLKQVDLATNQILKTVPRTGMYQAQTPQVFARQLLETAYANRGKITDAITDDAQLVECLGHAVHIVPGAPLNFKITTPDDFRFAETLLAPMKNEQTEQPRFYRDDPL